jgi:hypothetical protein
MTTLHVLQIPNYPESEKHQGKSEENFASSWAEAFICEGKGRHGRFIKMGRNPISGVQQMGRLRQIIAPFQRPSLSGA